MRQGNSVACMGEKRNNCRIFVGRSEENRKLGRTTM
jgi:hypothetical protein